MKLPLFASKVHKYLGLIIGLQFVFWVVSGAFFAIIPLSKIHSDHLVKDFVAGSISAAEFTQLQEIISSNTEFERFEILNSRRGPIVLAHKNGSIKAFDPKTGAMRSEISTSEAKQIANDTLINKNNVKDITRIEKHNLEYKGEIPAYQVIYEDGFTLYIGANSGEVRARRSKIWRIYDTLWALHIMDWVNHDNFNNSAIRIVASLAIMLVLFGLVLIPYRFRWKKR